MFKKAVSGVVVIIMLFLASTLFYFATSNWFNSYVSDLTIKVDEGNIKTDLEVLEVRSGVLTINNQYGNDLVVNEVLIDGVECEITPVEIDKGVSNIDIGDCSDGFLKVKGYEVLVKTNKGVLSTYEVLGEDITEETLIVSFQTSACDFGNGYVRLYGLTDLNSAHADIDGSSTYNLCVKSSRYTLGTSSLGNFVNIFYLTNVNNSMIWTNKTNIYIEPTNWYNVSLSSSGGSFDKVISSSRPSNQYVCIGIIDEDNVYGSHIGDCNSTMNDKIWISLN